MIPRVTVLIHPLATREYRKACRWYGKKSTQTEEHFRTAVRHTIDRIEENPLQGSIYLNKYRFLKVAKFLFVIYYRQVARDQWLVTAIAHSSRRPRYWLKRQ